MSNKTPEKPAEKTASAHSTPQVSSRKKLQTIHILYASIALLILAWFSIWAYVIFVQKGSSNCVAISDVNRVGDPATNPKNISGPQVKCLRLERVSSPEAIEKGLSGRPSMAEDQGMLFTFAQPGEHCFWMKEMNFPIDIVWMDENKKVVYVKEDARPDSYPQSFCPEQPAKFVLEVNAGIADRALISQGSQLQF